MTARNVAARILKLEAGHRRQDGILLVWRKPGADVLAAVSGADYSPGDKVICVEWCSSKPMSAPKWLFDRRFDDETEKELNRTLESVASGSLQGPRDPAFIDYPRVPEHRLVDMTDLDLWHAMFGVAV